MMNIQNNPPQNLFNGTAGQLPQFDEQMFRKLLPRLDRNMVEQAIQQARMSGMSEQIIQQGMNLLQRFK